MAANPDQLVWNTYSLEDYNIILKTCSAIKAIDNGLEKKYRIEFAGSTTISHYEFIFTHDGLLKEMISYYSQEIQKDEDDKNSPKVKPRISISFSAYKITPVLNYKEEFDESRYFTQINNRLIPAERYKRFKISDQRLYKNRE
jgi:isocitrate dehydrogenase kinase/phosphatase